MQLYNNQVAKFNQYKAFILGLAEMLSVDAIVAPVKKYDRCLEKVQNDYSGDWTQIKDILRSTVIVKDQNDIDNLINYLGDNFKIVKQFVNFGDTKDGYQGGNFVIVWEGFMVEIQFNTAINLAAKDGYMYRNALVDSACKQIERVGLVAGMGHKYYEVTRTVEGFSKTLSLQISKKYYSLCRMA